MNVAGRYLVIAVACIAAVPVASTVAGAPTPGNGWVQINRDITLGLLWDRFTNRHYGGFNNSVQWPGDWWNNDTYPVERRTMANYKGFVIGARNVPDPQYPTVVWPYMVGQRDGQNDGERGESILTAPPDPLLAGDSWAAPQILFKGRLARRTFRQANASVTVDGIANARLTHILPGDPSIKVTPELAGDADDTPYQADVIDPTIPADVMLETYSWTRMGVSNNRMVYAFVDRRNDDYMYWHWRLINDGIWGRLGVDRVDCCGGMHGAVEGVMISLMFQWDRASKGAFLTNSYGEESNDTIWRYYGVDYDGARTEDMRLVYVIDGDQNVEKFPAYANHPNASTDDIGDPDPVTGELHSAKTAGWQILHYDVSGADKHDDPAQPRTIGWRKYGWLIRTNQPGPYGFGHEAKYKQLLLGYHGNDEYYPGSVQETPLRGRHPHADDLGASWIKASNDPATSGAYWPGKVLGIDPEVTDVEQQAGFGPDDIAPGDTINALYALGVKGLDIPACKEIGARWLRGEVTDAEKDALVHGTIDSLFAVMRQAKSVYEAASFDDRYASSRGELEQALRTAVVAGRLWLSPPAPASFDVVSGSTRRIDLSWTLNTSTGSSIAGWRIYRSTEGCGPDVVWTRVHDAPPTTLAWVDTAVTMNRAHYYYLVTVDAAGHESTMWTRTDMPAVPGGSLIVCRTARGLEDCPTDMTEGTPLAFSLTQNAPNPFNPSTAIRFALASPGVVRLAIYATDGRIVRVLADGPLAAGDHAATWDGRDASGRACASGTYLYRLAGGNSVSIRRMTLAR